MNLNRSIAIIVLLACTTFGFEDSLAPATSVHTKVALPPPYRTGEVFAEFDHNRKKGVLSFRSLTIKIGSRTITVPKRILDFFEGPMPATIQFLVSPTLDPDNPVPDSFHVSFRYISYAYEGLGWPDTEKRPTGCIYVSKDSLRGIGRWEINADGSPKGQLYNTNLKKVKYLE